MTAVACAEAEVGDRGEITTRGGATGGRWGHKDAEWEGLPSEITGPPPPLESTWDHSQ